MEPRARWAFFPAAFFAKKAVPPEGTFGKVPLEWKTQSGAPGRRLSEQTTKKNGPPAIWQELDLGDEPP